MPGSLTSQPFRGVQSVLCLPFPDLTASNK